MHPLPDRRPLPSVIAVVVKVPYDRAQPQHVGRILSSAIRAALSTPEARSVDPDEDAPIMLDVVAIGPHQINILDGDLVTVTYPVGADTVLSVQPDGTVETRAPGSEGPYERGLKRPDRIIFAPLGRAGNVYLVPFTETIPNE
jgi:hypothetical protein